MSTDLVHEKTRLDPAMGCWNWTGSLNNYGYGLVKVGGRNLSGHRMSWEAHHGPIPAGLHVLHHCDNPRCCNPEHLYLGTHTDNMQDMIRRKRRSPRGPDKTPRKRRSVINVDRRHHISCANRPNERHNSEPVRE